MDHFSTDDAAPDSAGSRRSRMRSGARSRRTTASTVPDHFRTPTWLERSFVLPLTEPEPIDGVADVPTPRPRQHRVPQQRPQQMSAQSSPGDLHRDPVFVRPPSDDIDFSAVIRRADRSRWALRTAWVSTGVAGVLLILFLLTSVPAIAALAALGAVVSVSATVVRLQLARAPVPRVQR
ncbi:MAG: hypothetical protein ABWY19_04565 [Marmoricola sp.]